MKRTAEGSRCARWRRQAIGVTGVLLAVGLVLAPAGAFAQRRVALVIGNAAYVEPDARLTNPVNDARDVAEALGALDFDEVFLREDLDREGMEQAVDDFIATLRAGDVGVFYYAGHGLELDDGENYLAPVDFSSSYTPVRARNRALQANEVQALMEEAGARTRIVILDACRNNPFERVRSLTRGGLGQMTPRGGLVAYATEAGDTAADNGANGADRTAKQRFDGWTVPVADCTDGAVWTSPVGAFAANGSGCTTCSATCGSGWRTAGTTTTTVRPGMARRGRAAGTAVAVCCAAVPGSTIRCACARRIATTAMPARAAPPTAFVFRGRPINSCIFISLPPGEAGGGAPQRSG